MYNPYVRTTNESSYISVSDIESLHIVDLVVPGKYVIQARLKSSYTFELYGGPWETKKDAEHFLYRLGLIADPKMYR